jgi:hypothetical protein
MSAIPLSHIQPPHLPPHFGHHDLKSPVTMSRSGLLVEWRVEKLSNRDSRVTALDGKSDYTKPRRTLSASAREKMILAQKERWSKARRGSEATKTMDSAPVKRTMSASARRGSPPHANAGRSSERQRRRQPNIRREGKAPCFGGGFSL